MAHILIKRAGTRQPSFVISQESCFIYFATWLMTQARMVKTGMRNHIQAYLPLVAFCTVDAPICMADGTLVGIFQDESTISPCASGAIKSEPPII